MSIEIRQYDPKDAESHYAAVEASIESLKKWFSWASPNYCLCDSIKFIKDQPNRENMEKYDYAIFDADDSGFLGSCGLTKVRTYNGEQIASMSYWRRQDSNKRHVMREAVIKVKEKAFKELGIKRIEIDIAYCNKASIKVAESVGAKPERDIPIRGGDGRIHEGVRYVIGAV
ncbi:MAG: GNAT family N-acetyltransferase [Chloroflexi bacterium]|nr:GNAT family N-acetyltransferase [Chloroflexota bacterium]